MKNYKVTIITAVTVSVAEAKHGAHALELATNSLNYNLADGAIGSEVQEIKTEAEFAQVKKFAMYSSEA